MFPEGRVFTEFKMRSVLLSLFLQLMLLKVYGDAAFQCPTAFWVFGDSLSDTGNAVAAFPGTSALVLNNPYGESYTFEDKPGHNRFCDGRLVIDFIAQAFRFPFFGSYQHALNAANYKRGANFAYSGASARPDTTFIFFYLQLQLNQFFYFKNVTLAPSYPQGLRKPKSDSFTKGAYIIPEIGDNDFFIQYLVDKVSPSQVIQKILPQTIAAVESAIVQLHASGARLIIVFNNRPQGCTSRLLTLLGNYSARDSMGCLDAYNAVNRAYNAQLNQTMLQLQRRFNDDTQLIQFDYYAASVEIITNAAAYGFNPKTTLQACCGNGGPYNYNPYVACGNSGFVPSNSTNFVNISKACSDPQAAIQWDGIHLTEAFYRQISKFFLTGRFVHPPLNLAQACDLSFEDF